MNDPLRPDDTLLTISQVATRLDLPVGEVYSLIDCGALTAYFTRTDHPQVTERHLRAYLTRVQPRQGRSRVSTPGGRSAAQAPERPPDPTKQEPPPDPLLTSAEAAECLGISIRVLWARIKAGRLPVLRLPGHRLRFRRSELGKHRDASDEPPQASQAV